MGAPTPFVTSAAVVLGLPAHVLGRMLRAAVRRGEFDTLPPAAREQALATVRAIEMAGEAWYEKTSAAGSSETRSAETPAHSHHELSTAEAADLMGVTDRRVRQLAPELGRKVGTVWVLDPALVAAHRAATAG